MNWNRMTELIEQELRSAEADLAVKADPVDLYRAQGKKQAFEFVLRLPKRLIAEANQQAEG